MCIYPFIVVNENMLWRIFSLGPLEFFVRYVIFRRLHSLYLLSVKNSQLRVAFILFNYIFYACSFIHSLIDWSIYWLIVVVFSYIIQNKLRARSLAFSGPTVLNLMDTYLRNFLFDLTLSQVNFDSIMRVLSLLYLWILPIQKGKRL